MKAPKFLPMGLLVLGLVFAVTGFATPIGILSVSQCAGGGVTVTLTTLDWLTPTGGGNGCLVTDVPTNVTYTGGGPLNAGDTTGTIKDLSLGGPTPVLDFMFFSDQPNLHFDLISLGPGAANTVCSAALNPNNPNCSVAPGSPTILTPTATGTTVTLSAIGTARDLSAQISNWSGLYTAQFPAVTPAQLQSAILSGTSIAGFCTGGACTDSYSGSFTVTTIPEPVTPVLIGAGLLALASLRRRRSLV